MNFSRTLLLLLTNICVLSAHQRSKRQGNKTRVCITPEGQPGHCLNTRDCPALINVLKKLDEDPNVKDIFLKLRCGGYAEVCCRIEARNHKIKPRALDNDNVCGKSPVMSTARIVGGQPAELGAWPWVAVFGYKYNDSDTELKWKCGGTLINKRYILTAAHCIQLPEDSGPMQLDVIRLGEHDLENDVDGAINYGFEKTFIVPNNSTPFLDDIALLRLDKDVVYSDRIRPICLPTLENLRTSNYEGLYPFVIGWGDTMYNGSSNVLLQVQVPVVDLDSCKEIYGMRNFIITTNQLCAGYAEGGKDSCAGDSGGPLMLPINGVFYQIGIISYGGGCAEPLVPGVYTRVSSYLKWIEKSITESS